MEETKKRTLATILWSVGSIIALLLDPLFMWVVYACKVGSNPNISITCGYWVGFILIIVPICALIYGYISKLKHPENKSYIALYIISIISIALIAIMIFAGLSISAPMN